MKKKIFYIAIIVICLSIITGGTFAYYTATDTARNVIISGGVDVKVAEYQMVDGTMQNYPSQPIKVMPATSVSKVVTAKSLENDAWLRMTYSLEIYDSEGKLMDVSAEEMERFIIVKLLTEDWEYKDGWWYYIKAIGGGEETSPLINEIEFSGPEMGNEYQESTLLVVVTAQAVQKANNGTNVMNALGWPEI